MVSSSWSPFSWEIQKSHLGCRITWNSPKRKPVRIAPSHRKNRGRFPEMLARFWKTPNFSHRYRHSFRCEILSVSFVTLLRQAFSNPPTKPIPLPGAVATLTLSPDSSASSRFPDRPFFRFAPTFFFFIVTPSCIRRNQKGQSHDRNSGERLLPNNPTVSASSKIRSARSFALPQRCIWTSSGVQHCSWRLAVPAVYRE